MIFTGKSTLEIERRNERRKSWHLRFAFWPTKVSKLENGSEVKIWLRFYEQRWVEGWNYKIRYKDYPEIGVQYISYDF